jgi:hypothetical protein
MIYPTTSIYIYIHGDIANSTRPERIERGEMRCLVCRLEVVVVDFCPRRSWLYATTTTLKTNLYIGGQ